MRRSLMVLLVVVGLAGCGTLNTGVEDLTLRYGGGITEEKEYKGLIQPGTTNQFVFGSGTGDSLYHYPRTQRSWIAGETEGVDRPPVEIVTSDGVRMKVDYALYFRLNPTEEVLRRFHEDIGLKEGAWTDDGWLEMLRTYFDAPITRQLEAVGLNFSSEELRSDDVKRREFATTISQQATTEIERVVGGPYFCGPEQGGCGNISFEVGRPELVNTGIVEAEEAKRIATLEADAQEERNRRVLTQLEATREEVEVLGPETYALIKAIESGRVSFMQLPENGAGVTVPAPRTEGQ
jgi:regulator of protease activity HflC (stomatin/prohibitin superfamily)